MSNKEQEQEQFQDDLEIEMIDLDKHDGKQDDDGTASSLQPTLRVPLKSQLSPRQRVLRSAVTVGIVVLAVFIILGYITPLRASALALFLRPTPSPGPAIVPGSNFFYVDASPSWGKLFVDGQFIRHPPTLIDASMQLAPGRHQLVWRATPFRPVSCFISVPITSHDTCHYTQAVADQFGPIYPNVRPNSWKILLYESMNTLPASQKAALVQAIQTALDAQQSTETVYPGEQYIHSVGKHIIDTATRPLRATLRFKLDTADADHGANSPCLSDLILCSIQIPGQSQNCLLICTQPNFDGPTHGWFASVIMYSVWDYTTFDGQIVAQNQPNMLPGAIVYPQFVLLQLTWQGGNWHVAVGHPGLGSEGLACAPVNSALNAAVTNGLNGGFQLFFASGTVPADGCLAVVQPASNNPATSPTPRPPVAYFLYRFGVLLAANDFAHHVQPHLPLADAYERSLAQQILASYQRN